MEKCYLYVLGESTCFSSLTTSLSQKVDLLPPALDSGSWGWTGHSVSSLQILRALYAVDDQSILEEGMNEWNLQNFCTYKCYVCAFDLYPKKSISAVWVQVGQERH